MKWEKNQASNQQEKQTKRNSQETLNLNQNKKEANISQGELIAKLTELNLIPEEVEYERRKDIARKAEEILYEQIYKLQAASDIDSNE